MNRQIKDGNHVYIGEPVHTWSPDWKRVTINIIIIVNQCTHMTRLESRTEVTWGDAISALKDCESEP
jgi:hypothetical protein